MFLLGDYPEESPYFGQVQNGTDVPQTRELSAVIMYGIGSVSDAATSGGLSLGVILCTGSAAVTQDTIHADAPPE